MRRRNSGRTLLTVFLVLLIGTAAGLLFLLADNGRLRIFAKRESTAAETQAESTARSSASAAETGSSQTGQTTEATTEATTETQTAAETTPAPTESSTKDPMLEVTCFVYVTAESLNVRAKPSTEGEIIGGFLREEEVPAIGRTENGWYKVVCDGQIGYVSGDYVTEDRDWKEKQEQEYPYGYQNGEAVTLQAGWEYADMSAVHSGAAVMYRASANRKNLVIGLNAGHGCSGGQSYQTYSHPDGSAKLTGGTNPEGAVMSTAISTGMSFTDGTEESLVNLRVAQRLRDLLLAEGFDVLMIRDGEDVQLDNVARTVICNNAADCHIAIHFDGDGLSYDKGCFFMSVPDGLKSLPTVASVWEESEALGRSLIQGLSAAGNLIYDTAGIDQDLTQTSYSTVPSVDIELGNQSSDISEEHLARLAEGLLGGILAYYGY